MVSEWKLDPAFHTPGWAERRLKELREEEEMARSGELKVPIRLVQEEERQDALLPPLKVRAVLDQEQLEAIRQVVKEELAPFGKPPVWNVEPPEVLDLTNMSSSPILVSKPEQQSLTASFVYEGKLYQGTLYFVNDVE